MLTGTLGILSTLGMLGTLGILGTLGMFGKLLPVALLTLFNKLAAALVVIGRPTGLEIEIVLKPDKGYCALPTIEMLLLIVLTPGIELVKF